jgi:hypothetical protein
MQTVTEYDYLKTWALYAFCTALGGMVAGAVAGGVLGAILGASGWSPKSVAIPTALAGFIASLPVSFFFFRLFVSRMLASKAPQSIAPSDVAAT